MRDLLVMGLKTEDSELTLSFRALYEWFLEQFCLKNRFHCMKDYLS